MKKKMARKLVVVVNQRMKMSIAMMKKKEKVKYLMKMMKKERNIWNRRVEKMKVVRVRLWRKEKKS